MQKQSEAIGFGGDKSKTRFLTKAELDELEKIGEVNVPTHDALEKEWNEFQKAQKAYQKKLTDKETQSVMAELRKEQEESRKLKKENDRLKREAKKKMDEMLKIAAETVAKTEIKIHKQETERANKAEAERAKAVQRANDLASQNAAQAARIAMLEKMLAEKG
jgi:seryl-tRNA synthetase